jgi:ribonuclease BN (tRNA processing enzyme)
MNITYYGTRGSIPVAGKDTIVYGGNTACVKVMAEDTLIILDAGSGLWRLGLELMKTEFLRGQGIAHMFFSHLHWDHINGFPFFKPAYIKNNTLILYSVKNSLCSLEQALTDQQQYINFPVKLTDMNSKRIFKEMPEGGKIKCGPATISNFKLDHPGGAYAYKIEAHDKKVVYATDNESRGKTDPKLIEFSKNADILIYDAMFTPQEYKLRAGWGHSTYQEGVKTAKAAGVKQLHLFHYNPEHSDTQIEKIEQEAQRHFPETFAAREGLSIDLSTNSKSLS